MVSFGHTGGLGLVDGEPEPRVHAGIGVAGPSRAGDLANQPGEDLAALLVLGVLAMLDVRPLAMTCHAFPTG
jgi:hypothetical protein